MPTPNYRRTVGACGQRLEVSPAGPLRFASRLAVTGRSWRTVRLPLVRVISGKLPVPLDHRAVEKSKPLNCWLGTTRPEQSRISASAPSAVTSVRPPGRFQADAAVSLHRPPNIPVFPAEFDLADEADGELPVRSVEVANPWLADHHMSYV